jgi:geranylgeranyl transferase type-2 subunit beta
MMEQLDEVPPFFDSLHESYITSLAAKLDAPSSYEGAVTEHLRMSGVYWSITALSLICTPDEVDKKMGLTDSIVDWVFQCYDPVTGSFGGNIGHDGHMLYTLSAVQILAVADRLSDPRLQVDQILKFVSSMQQPDGSFSGDAWGEVDTRFSYCAISCLSLLGALPSLRGGNEEQQNNIDLDKAVNYIASCRNFDGGFGCVPGAESHAGQIFCCVGALAIAGALHLLDDDLLCWWLAERQCDSGGLNGRPEKQADVCYSWWILSALSIMGRVQWINTKKLKKFILKCQDDVGKRLYYKHTTLFCAKASFYECNDSHNIIMFSILTPLLENSLKKMEVLRIDHTTWRMCSTHFLVYRDYLC